MSQVLRRDAVRAIARGLGAAIALTLAGMLILAALVVWARLGDRALIMLNQALKIAAIGLGALIAVKPGGRRGLALGGCVGLVYIALGYGLTALSGLALVTARMLVIEMAMGLLLGSLFGALAANLPARRRATAR
ncbi:MAG: TIGR04086 family membrane protein [Clostridia bacterium]|nr:TIGR04086 family membrane protein [Clostridia bacterium]